MASCTIVHIIEHISNFRHSCALQNHMRRGRLRLCFISRRLHLGEVARLRALLFAIDCPRDFDRLHPILGLDRVVALAIRLRRRFRRRIDQFTIGTARLALPTCLEELAHLEAWEGVSLGVEHDVCEREHVVGPEQEVEVFKGFGLRRRMLACLLQIARIGGWIDLPARSSPCCLSTTEESS